MATTNLRNVASKRQGQKSRKTQPEKKTAQKSEKLKKAKEQNYVTQQKQRKG